MTSCVKHPGRRATGNCRACDTECCADCLVFSFGRLRQPYCVPCALIASGVQARSHASPPTA